MAILDLRHVITADQAFQIPTLKSMPHFLSRILLGILTASLGAAWLPLSHKACLPSNVTLADRSSDNRAAVVKMQRLGSPVPSLRPHNLPEGPTFAELPILLEAGESDISSMSTRLQHAVIPVIETLEGRLLLSGSVQGTTLVVDGNATASNKINVSYVRKTHSIRIVENRVRQDFAIAGLTALQITGGSSKDIIVVGVGVTLPTTINGMGGNDQITGGAENDTIITGQGSSIVHPGLGHNSIDLTLGSNRAVLTRKAVDTIIATKQDKVFGATTSTVISAPSAPSGAPTSPPAPPAPPLPPPPPVPTQTDVPVQITPGSGYSGPAPQPAAIGSGYGSDANAIAQWDVIPYQTFSGTFNVGVVAFHINAIDHVEFSVNGGAVGNATKMILDPQTNVVEYTAQLNAADFTEGQTAEVRAVAYPTVGVPKVLPSLFLYADPNNTPSPTIYASQNGSNTGDGSAANPFGANLDFALDSVADGGTIVITQPGTYTINDGTGRLDRANTRWITVEAGPGLTNRDITIISPTDGQVVSRIGLMHWVNVGFDFSQMSQYAPDPGQSVWFDGCYWTANGWQNTDRPSPIATWSGSFAPDHSYATNCYAYNDVYGITVGDICRNCTADTISGLPFGGSSLLVNATVSNFNGNWESVPGATLDNLYHRDVFHVWDASTDHIVYGLTAKVNVDAQIINIQSDRGPLGTAGVAQDYAFVNIDAEPQPVVSGVEPNAGGPQFSQLEGNETNILFQNIYMPTQAWIMDPTVNNNGSDFVPHDMMFKGDGLHFANYYGYILNPQNIMNGVTFESCYSASTDVWAPSGLTGTVNSGQADLSWTPGPGTDQDNRNDLFVVRRSNDGGATWSDITQPFVSGQTTYVDSTLQAGTYLYVIKSFNNLTGAINYSNVVSVTVP